MTKWYQKYSKAVYAFAGSVGLGLVAEGIIVGKEAALVSVLIGALTTIGVIKSPANKS